MRPIHLPARYQRPAILAVVGAVVIAVIAGSLAWPRSDPTTAVSSPGGTTPASTTSASSGAPRPSETPEPSWSPEPATEEGPAVAQLTAIDASGPVLALDARFRLASLGDTPATELAKRLVVEPRLDLAVESAADGRSVELTPRDPLVPGAVYRFALRGEKDEELDSWAFQAKQPVRIVNTLPAHQATDVPRDTGIEITFDQDGVTNAASHVSIKPATKGRFEQHGRVLAFVPDSLKAATVYTVTISRGVTVEATGESMAADVSFQFETAAKGKTAEEATTVQFQENVYESATRNPPAFGIWGFGDPEKTPAKVRIDVFRLSGLDAAVSAFERLRAFPQWSRWSSAGLVATAGLPRVLSINAKLNQNDNALWVALPKPLPAGWYVIQSPTGTRPAQAILQVTDVSGYLVVSETRTMVWANDLATKGPIVGATVSASGKGLGRTDAKGLLTADTPAVLRTDDAVACKETCAPVVVLTTKDGRAAFLPGSGQQVVGATFADVWSGARPEGHWALLSTDRTKYRPTDTINVWGIVRNRDSGKVPTDVKIEFDPASSSDGYGPSTVGSITIKPGPTGVFTASIPVTDLPVGYHTLGLVVGGQVVQSTYFEVGSILKPAYQLEVETGRRIYVAGDQVKVTVRAKFFEGTPVPGVPLRLDGALERNMTTDKTGTSTHRMIAKDDEYTGGPSYNVVNVTPGRAEEGEIAGASRDFLVYPSSRTIDGESEITGGRVRVNGSVHLVDVDRLESEVAKGGYIWDLDPRGKPVSGTNVSVHFIELIPTKTRTGTAYDFIEKKAVPVYQYDTRFQDAGTHRVKTNAKGVYAVSIPASGAGHDYRVELTVGDPDGHKATATAYATATKRTDYGSEPGGLNLTSQERDFDGFGVGDRIDLTMSDPGKNPAAAGSGKYLFFVAQRGLRDVTIQSSPRFVTTFASWAPPNVEIGAVRFTGATYVVGGMFSAGFRETDRRLDVDLSIDSPRYAPGDVVKVNVRTRNAKGAPVAATLVMRAVDEKLFSIGAAADGDPLAGLYGSVRAGIVATYQSHRVPRNAFEGGDTGGGGDGDRSDFRDTALFKAIETGDDGRGSVSFKLPDDVTSWRVSASAFTVGLEAGKSVILVPVGLPLFVDAAIAPEYLTADRPTIQVRAFGSALKEGSAVTFTASSKSLKFTSAPIKSTAFATVGVPLPPLTQGVHDLTISATSGTGSSSLSDRLTRRFVVVDSRLARTRTAYVDLDAGVRLESGSGMTTVVLSDAGVGAQMGRLVDLAAGSGARLDRALAADLAASMLEKRLGSAEARGLVDAFVAERYRQPDGGLALLPYGSSDLELSAMVAIAAPKHDAAASLRSYFSTIRSTPAETRERRNFALAGLAGLGAPVLPDIQAAATASDLTVREQLMIGIGAASLGDAATARSIATALANKYGESHDQVARLRVGSSAADVTTATARMAILAAAIGDSRAPAYWSYVEGNPSVDELNVLHAVAYVVRTLDRLPVETASVAYTLDGVREVVDLDRGQSFGLTLSAAQMASLKLEHLSGAVGVTTSWREPVKATALERDPDVALRRFIKPAGTIGTDDLVQVDLFMDFKPKAPKGCYQVTDLAPSGLVPVGSLAGWINPDTGEPSYPNGVIMPYAQTGQRVSFCAVPFVVMTGPEGLNLRYYARVVTPGTYAWEPAIAESKTGANRAATTPQAEITIR